ncbi:bifunctional 5,10-methylenetetrahydrofolate dehydrogenase/5,10-methenyltetrahydrofolate cyclohydrolase [Williamsia maris]|uniref:Bifunctional protein FolD n=1 Tax=Williamsia maris TaxID=72806 RepID=A0ABT1HIF2_9NOCA|nr:bifunctional 5,10-methylenetetrahydrofolate dehydrogenase/5,10-methenyltetrahydrofolate cyclohydrolase [Williamsia maris]MCP2177660.1 methylenetetrahydrofolate dehydrogenase (NADP+) / methenyltetrahydrofolate cyclohydrolase [Williamsia maris]
MTAQILDGSSVATQMLASLRSAIADSVLHPTLATVLVGDDPASHTYVGMKTRRAASVGIATRAVTVPASASTDEVVQVVAALDADPYVHGILVQHPLPAQVDERRVFDTIADRKDVDGVTSASFASMSLNTGGFRGCTPGGILTLLDHFEIPLTGRRAVVVGRSPILGLPMGMLMLARDATVTYCHSRTSDLAHQIRDAEVVIAAAGSPQLVKADWVARDAVVVDAGYHPGGIGDVEPGAAERAGWITPVPGGVGPMTIATLLTHTARAAGVDVTPATDATSRVRSDAGVPGSSSNDR